MRLQVKLRLFRPSHWPNWPIEDSDWANLSRHWPCLELNLYSGQILCNYLKRCMQRPAALVLGGNQSFQKFFCPNPLIERCKKSSWEKLIPRDRQNQRGGRRSERKLEFDPYSLSRRKHLNTNIYTTSSCFTWKQDVNRLRAGCLESIHRGRNHPEILIKSIIF